MPSCWGSGVVSARRNVSEPNGSRRTEPVADDGESGRIGTTGTAPADVPPGEEGAPGGSVLERLWLVPPSWARRPERLAGVVLGLGVLVAAVWFAARSVRDWLHAQPAYQMRFDELVLEPEVPAYIKIGKEGLLEEVRKRAGLGEEVALLNLDLGELARALALEPWIRSVEQVERGFPPRLTVRVRYREPVARAWLSRAGWVVLDREGVVLEAQELNLGATGPLVVISHLDRAEAALDPRVGVSLGEPGSEARERVKAAVALADFLRRQTQGGSGRLVSPIGFSQVSAVDGAHELMALTTDGLWVRWGSAPGDELESRNEPSALAKWSMMMERLARPEDRKPRNENVFLEFTRDGARLRQGDRRSG